MKLSGAGRNKVRPTSEGSSESEMVLRSTGRLVVLYNSNQSAPPAALGIHSFRRRAVLVPRTALAAFTAPGVAELNSRHWPLFAPIGRLSTCRPYSTKFTT